MRGERELRLLIREELLRPTAPSPVVRLIVREYLGPPPPDAERLWLERIRRRWAVVDEHFAPRRRLSLRESRRRRLLAEALSDLAGRAWRGMAGLAKAVGGKAVEAGEWALKKAAKLTGKVAEVVKRIGEGFRDIIVYAIKQLPGGEVVLEFLTEVAGKLKEKIIAMRDAIGEQVEEFVKGAKKRLIDLFFKHVLSDDSMKADFYKAMGVTEDELESIKRESRRRGLTTITELNAHLDRTRLLEAEEGGALADVAGRIKGKTGIADAEEVAKALGAIENEGPDKVNPEEVLRGKAAGVIEKLIDFWMKLVEQNPERYHKAFYDSGFFNVFGETGWGLASASLMGILAAGELKWDDLVRFVKSIMRGFEGGSSRPPGSTSNRAGAFLFLGNKGNEYDSSLFKSFVTGIIKGSNLEVIVRALAGDVSKIPEIAKRIMAAIIGGVRSAVKANKVSAAVAQAAGEEGGLADEVEDEVNGVVGDYIDEMFTT